MKSLSKKITAVLISATLTFSLCACGSKNDNPENKTEKNIVQTDAQNGYESKTYNLKFTPPENFVMFSDSQKAAQMNGSKNTSCEMIAEHNDGFPQVKVIFEKFGGNENEYLSYIKTSLESGGINASYTEPSDTEIAEETYRGFTACVEESVNMEIYAKKYDGGILCISVTSLVGDSDSSTLLGAFSKIG